MTPTGENYTSLFAHLQHQPVSFPRLNRLLMQYVPYWGNALAANKLSETTAREALDLKRKSDTIFVFGSGYSVLDISEAEWDFISQHNTLSFNWFIYQQFVPVDYHVVRETYSYVKTLKDLKRAVRHYAETLVGNPNYDDTVLFIQKGKAATSGNCMIADGLVPPGRTISRFVTKSRGTYEPPSKDPDSEGLVHGPGTLIDSLNLAIYGGWKDIVLVGVDLYDRRYFWLGRDESNGGRDAEQGVDVVHNTTKNGVIDHVAKWHRLLAAEGRGISVYNPKSLLADEVPVYSRPNDLADQVPAKPVNRTVLP